MDRVRIAVIFSALALAAAGASWGVEMRGAEAVITGVQKASTTAPAAPAPAAGPMDDELKAYESKLAGVSAEESAAAWLALLDHAMKLPARDDSPDGAGIAQRLIQALPGPESWKAIEEGLQKRPAGTGEQEVRELGWKFFGRILAADQAGEKDLL